MMRRQALQWITVAGTMADINVASAFSEIEDDGQMELTPEYNVQRVEGEPSIAVYARFTSMRDKSTVRLRQGDSLSVNGVALRGEPHKSGFVYRGALDASETRIAFVLKRGSQAEVRHDVAVPAIGVPQLPKRYRRYETLHVPVRYDEPAGYVRESYSFWILAQPLRFSLISTTRSKEHRYEMGRLPDIRDGHIVFRPINDFGLNPGVHPAELFRQHHIALRDLSPHTPRGWIYLTNTVNFSVEVL